MSSVGDLAESRKRKVDYLCYYYYRSAALYELQCEVVKGKCALGPFLSILVI
jgi:hypothetical protein